MDCLASGVSLFTYLPIASFAIALAGLLVRFLIPGGPARQTALAAALLFLVLVSAVTWQQDNRCREQVEQTADDVVRILGNQKLTYEQIVANTRNPTYFMINAGIDLLLRQKRVGTELATFTDRDSGKAYQITLFFVRTP